MAGFQPNGLAVLLYCSGKVALLAEGIALGMMLLCKAGSLAGRGRRPNAAGP